MTLIGHLCREAMRDFVSTLIDLHQPPVPNPNKALTVLRLKAILQHKKASLSDAVSNLMMAQISNWEAVNDLI